MLLPNVVMVMMPLQVCGDNNTQIFVRYCELMKQLFSSYNVKNLELNEMWTLLDGLKDLVTSSSLSSCNSR